MSAKKKRAEEHEEHENHERWLISYADMITLLAALFIVLFAMSRLDIMKFEKFARALGASLKGSSGGPASVIDSGSSGVGSGGDGFFDGIAPSKTGSASVEQALIEQQQQEEAGRLERQSFEVTKEQILTALRSVGLESKVTLKIDERGLVVNIVTDEVLFASGSAELRPQGRAVLDGLAPALRNLANHMSIAGHTDDVPISGTFASNWELSAERGVSVLRYLAETRGVPPSRMQVDAHADQEPLVPNDTPEHRAMNRRVEIVVIARTPSENKILGG